MKLQESGPRGAGNAGTALNATCCLDYSGPNRAAEAPTDPAYAALRLEAQRVAHRERRRVETDLTEFEREVRADDNLAREAWGSRSADAIRQDQLTAPVTIADFLRAARLLVYIAAKVGLHAAEGPPW